MSGPLETRSYFTCRRPRRGIFCGRPGSPRGPLGWRPDKRARWRRAGLPEKPRARASVCLFGHDLSHSGRGLVHLLRQLGIPPSRKRNERGGEARHRRCICSMSSQTSMGGQRFEGRFILASGNDMLRDSLCSRPLCIKVSQEIKKEITPSGPPESNPWAESPLLNIAIF